MEGEARDMQLLKLIVNPAESLYRALGEEPDPPWGAEHADWGVPGWELSVLAQRSIGMKRCCQTKELNALVCPTFIFNPGGNRGLPVKSGFLLALRKTQPPGCPWQAPACFLWV